jgi:hypothetical protein
MAKSRNRGGAKAHRKRVANRNQKINATKKKMQKMYTDMFTKKMEELQTKFSGETEEQVLNAQEIVDNLKVQLPEPVSKQE